jgi:predicted N-acetyltransferase YhbS
VVTHGDLECDSVLSCSIRQLTDPLDPAFAGLERVYTSALPAGERKPAEQLRQSILRPDYRVLVAEEAAGQVVGFAMLFVPQEPENAALLEYLATAGPARGRGVGGRLFRHAVALAGRAVLIEVETGDADAERRGAFYRRHGCRELTGLQYLLPLPGAPPMGLMVAGAAEIQRADVRRWLEVVYERVYGESADDPRIELMTAGTADPIGLK